MKLFVLSLALVLSAFSANTTVVGTYNNAEGRPANGTLVLTVTRSFTNDGKTVLVSRRSYSIRNGTLSLSLVPNVGSTPASYYSVSTSIENGPVEVSNWVVPFSATPVTVASVTTVMPPPPPDFFLPLSRLNTSGALLDYVIKFNGTSPVWAAAPGGASNASSVAFNPTGSISSTNVQAAIAELGTEKQAALGFTPENSANRGASNGYAPLDSSSKVPSANLPTATASGTTFSATGGISSTNVQSALSELDTEKQATLGFTPENSANRNVAGGYAPLDGSVKVPLANLPNIPESQLTLNNATHSNANDPSLGEKAALAGTSGTPGGGNKYVTNADWRLTVDALDVDNFCTTPGTRDQTCIQNAINSASNGSTILINHTYTISAGITITAKERLVLTGRGTLRAANNLNATIISSNSGCMACKFTGLTFEGNRENQSSPTANKAIHIIGPDQFGTEISHCQFNSFAGTAVTMESPAFASMFGWIIENNKFNDLRGQAMYSKNVSGNSSFRGNVINYSEGPTPGSLPNSCMVTFESAFNIQVIGNSLTVDNSSFVSDFWSLACYDGLFVSGMHIYNTSSNEGGVDSPSFFNGAATTQANLKRNWQPAVPTGSHQRAYATPVSCQNSVPLFSGPLSSSTAIISSDMICAGTDNLIGGVELTGSRWLVNRFNKRIKIDSGFVAWYPTATVYRSSGSSSGVIYIEVQTSCSTGATITWGTTNLTSIGFSAAGLPAGSLGYVVGAIAPTNSSDCQDVQWIRMRLSASTTATGQFYLHNMGLAFDGPLQ